MRLLAFKVNIRFCIARAHAYRCSTMPNSVSSAHQDPAGARALVFARRTTLHDYWAALDDRKRFSQAFDARSKCDGRAEVK